MGQAYVVIGDGIAGSSAAETLREEAPDADITVITDEGEPLYNRILIKEFAKGKLPETPISIHDEEWYTEREIDLRLNTHVTGFDPVERVIHTHEGEAIEYDKLLVASGGIPSQLPVKGSTADGIHHFWTFQDARAIREHVEQAETGVVIGAGLLGIDLAAICAANDVKAHYLMRGQCWWRYALSQEGGDIIHRALEERDVTPVFDSGADHFETEDGRVVATIDANGDRYPSEFVGVAIGLNFNLEFLQDVDIEMDNGIVVDEYMRTSLDNVYAAGDITRFYDTITNQYEQNGSWGSAKTQGQVAGKNMAADDAVEPFRWVSSYSITHFDFPFLSFGHPTIGDRYLERKYDDDDSWRRIAVKDGKVVGGVLIRDLAPQTALKRLIREEVSIEGREETLLEDSVDVSALMPTLEG